MPWIWIRSANGDKMHGITPRRSLVNSPHFASSPLFVICLSLSKVQNRSRSKLLLRYGQSVYLAMFGNAIGAPLFVVVNHQDTEAGGWGQVKIKPSAQKQVSCCCSAGVTQELWY